MAKKQTKKPDEKRTPKDPNQLAAFIVDAATNQPIPEFQIPAKRCAKKQSSVDKKD